jgi:hypothetical protein
MEYRRILFLSLCAFKTSRAFVILLDFLITSLLVQSKAFRARLLVWLIPKKQSAICFLHFRPSSAVLQLERRVCLWCVFLTSLLIRQRYSALVRDRKIKALGRVKAHVCRGRGLFESSVCCPLAARSQSQLTAFPFTLNHKERSWGAERGIRSQRAQKPSANDGMHEGGNFTLPKSH